MASTEAHPDPLPCGLYRTGAALPEHEDHLGAGLLVYFHNHSEAGDPLVLLPAKNTNNRWTWQERGHLVQDRSFLLALAPLPPEGFYALRRPLFAGDGGRIPERGLVQLGYDRAASPILFIPEQRSNALIFPDTGVRWEDPSVVFAAIDAQPLLVPSATSAPEHSGDDSPQFH